MSKKNIAYKNMHKWASTSENVPICHVRPTTTQISLRIHAVWLESSLSARRNFASLAIRNAPSEDSDQTARMRRLIWIFAGRTHPKVRFLTFGLVNMNNLIQSNVECAQLTGRWQKSFRFVNLVATSIQMPIWFCWIIVKSETRDTNFFY